MEKILQPSAEATDLTRRGKSNVKVAPPTIPVFTGKFSTQVESSAGPFPLAQGFIPFQLSAGTCLICPSSSTRICNEMGN